MVTFHHAVAFGSPILTDRLLPTEHRIIGIQDHPDNRKKAPIFADTPSPLFFFRTQRKWVALHAACWIVPWGRGLSGRELLTLSPSFSLCLSHSPCMSWNLLLLQLYVFPQWRSVGIYDLPPSELISHRHFSDGRRVTPEPRFTRQTTSAEIHILTRGQDVADLQLQLFTTCQSGK